MMDFFADNTIKKTIGLIIKHGKDIPTDKALWFNMTRRMFQIEPAHEVFNKVYQALEEAADKEWFEHKYPPGSLKETWVFPKIKKVNYDNLTESQKFIKDNLKITDVAQLYGFKVKGNKIICPFHDDKDPSLSLSDSKNVFNCFGCSAKGDIVEFIRRLESAGIKQKTS